MKPHKFQNVTVDLDRVLVISDYLENMEGFYVVLSRRENILQFTWTHYADLTRDNAIEKLIEDHTLLMQAWKREQTTVSEDQYYKRTCLAIGIEPCMFYFNHMTNGEGKPFPLFVYDESRAMKFDSAIGAQWYLDLYRNSFPAHTRLTKTL